MAGLLGNRTRRSAIALPRPMPNTRSAAFRRRIDCSPRVGEGVVVKSLLTCREVAILAPARRLRIPLILGNGDTAASGEVTQTFLSCVVADGEGNALIGVASSNLAALDDDLSVAYAREIGFTSGLHA